MIIHSEQSSFGVPAIASLKLFIQLLSLATVKCISLEMVSSAALTKENLIVFLAKVFYVIQLSIIFEIEIRSFC